MKLIIATVPPERLEAVQAALENCSAESIYVAQMRDLRAPKKELYRGVPYYPFRPAFRVEALVANEVFLVDTMNAVAAACAGGATPDGRGTLFVIDVNNWIPICCSTPHLTDIAA